MTLRLLGALHGRLVLSRRVRVLAEALAALLPPEGTVLDVGAGSGQVDALLLGLRPGLRIEGVDVLVRPGTAIPVTPYDGVRLPFPDGSFDWTLLVDTVHHADDPGALLAEAARVARRGVVLKDHVARGPFDRAVLRLMDWVGNRPHGVSCPCRYWSDGEWREAFRRTGLAVEAWEGRLGLYGFPAALLFERELHFTARLGRTREVRP